MNAATATDDVPRRVIRHGDALDELRRLPGGVVDQIVTSPPYYRLRDYDVDGQIGAESSIEGWVADMLAIADEATRVLVPTGTYWLNVGDTFATAKKDGAPRKSLLLGPERLALAMVDRGWILRSKVVWHKPNPTPSSVRDRLTSSWEYIYIFARAPRYYFDLDSIRQPLKQPASTPRKSPVDLRGHESWRGSHSSPADGLARMHQRGISGHPLGKNPGDLWTLAASRGHGDHHATFPLRLASRMVVTGCPERRCARCRAPHVRPVERLGETATRLALTPTCECRVASEPGLVCDPFMGSGTTAVAAKTLGRDWYGIELNPDFADAARHRVATASPP
ncbi:MAG: site-specific DNA-methyltransferase [Gordonia sp. (in: high G+C Gram-positive bacteria)]|uniref:DNA-methyltransferase n=1 Tax=Gordonia sp. (in: high G+C Gram-positive bacteria) TaxID=84139 RepID=UPI0039E4D847